MKIEDLKYLALEGGGGKGAVYNGAIRTIENKLGGSICDCRDTKERTKSILDYGKIEGGKFIPQIKGIAGSSAGAITSFALGLGLNSEEINTVLEDYPFENFLKDTHVGKYRMVGYDNEIIIGQDRGKKIGGNSTELFSRVMMRKKTIKDNYLKRKLRAGVLVICRETIISGIRDTIENLPRRLLNYIVFLFPTFFSSIIRQLTNAVDIPSVEDVEGELELNTENVRLVNNITDQINLPTSVIIRQALDYLIQTGLSTLTTSKKKVTPIKLDIDSISGVLFDRGAFSGLDVRDFFFRLTLFSISRNTYFKHRFINALNQNSLTLKQLSEGQKRKFKSIVESIDEYKINSTNEPTFSNWNHSITTGNKIHKSIKEFDEFISTLTFKDFFEITGIDVGFNVTNFTTDSPVFFSHKHTPDFPIIEAVGASMSIPPAIKPLYTQADVMTDNGDFSSKHFYLCINDDSIKITDEDGDLIKDNDKPISPIEAYHLGKAALKKYLSLKYEISTNNNIDNSSFLPLLKNEIKNFKGAKESILENYTVSIDWHTLLFYYNAEYKGMFFDGGATNNIPYNYFREEKFIGDKEGVSLEGVLALKLDNSFPSEWLQALKEDINKLDKIKKLQIKRPNINISDYYNYEIFESLNNPSLFVALNKKVKKNKIKLNKECWKKIRNELLSRYKSQKHSVLPWQSKKSIFGVISTIQYGSEQGQIRHLSDHKHIIPLYCYGIGVYDFEMAKLEPLLKLAQKKAEEQTERYFKSE